MSATSTRQQRRTKATQQQPEATNDNGFTAPTKLPQRRKLAPVLILLLALAGGLFFYLGFQGQGNVQVFTVTGDIQRGHVMSQQDLATITVAKDSVGDKYLDSDAAAVLGKTALVDLPKGSLVLKSNIGDKLPVADGTSIVGVSVSSAQLPSRPLKAGDHVRIIKTPTQGQTQEKTVAPISAIVDRTKFDNVKGITSVDVIVPSNIAPTISAWSASGNAGIILDADNEK